MKAETDKRYKAVVKHYQKGVLHLVYFEELNKAHTWLNTRWAKSAKLAADITAMQTDYGGAIYDRQDSRKRILVLGADYLTRENGNKRA
jgi:hypothetical protein